MSSFIVAALVVSITALAVAPLVLDDSYSWVEHTTSEAAGQGVDGAWVTRSGFLIFGLAVIWISHRSAGPWRQPATALHVTFGTCLAAVAAFSLRSWMPSATYDVTEDLLHSIAATVMGFAFAFGVVATVVRRSTTSRAHALDILAVSSSVVIPLCMAAIDDYAGALQRLMFLTAYLWYGHEAVGSSTRLAPRSPARSPTPTV